MAIKQNDAFLYYIKLKFFHSLLMRRILYFFDSLTTLRITKTIEYEGYTNYKNVAYLIFNNLK